MILSTFIVQYYFKFFFYLFFIAHYLNRIVIMDMCLQFIIVASYDELIINKVL